MGMKKIYKIFILGCLALMASEVKAQDKKDLFNPVNYAVISQTIAPDARGGGLGDIGAATDPDVNSQYWNPAKYPFTISRAGVSLSFTPWLRSLDVDAYLAKLLGPGFKLTHRSFEMEDMTIEFDDATQCYKIPVTGTVGYYRAVVTKLFKRSGKLHVTVGYIPTASDDDSIINVSSDTPTKYMDYLFERQSGSWYLTGLTESETKAESTDSTSAASLPEPMAESDVQDAILATAGSDAADSAASAVEPETQAENGADSAVAEAPAADDAASTAG